MTAKAFAQNGRARISPQLMLHLASALFVGSTASSWAQAAALAPGKYIVVLDGEPAAASFLRAKETKIAAADPAAAARAQAAALNLQQDAFAAELSALGAKEVARYSKLLNAVAVRASSDQAKAIRTLPGVKSVHPSQLYEVNTASSVPFIGTPNVWGGIAAADGTGVRIGIIDTGIDYTHADFGGSGVVSDYTSNNRTNIEAGTFPTAKVVGGYDFVGDAYNAGSTNTDTPVPDPDPLDCGGHGSHVAGIAAGFGVRTNGATYNGPYTNGMDFTQFRIGPGVAPRALLYALKVFGCSGSTDDSVLLQAVEWAADPNNDTNFVDRLDAVNLSIGSRFGVTGTNQPLHAALNMLADLGCVPVLSAGNSYDTFYIVGHPSVSEKTISVACSIDNGTTTAGVQVLSPASIVTNLNALEGAITVPLSQTGPVQGSLVYASPNTACPSLSNGGSMPGNIALIDRGGTSCSFTTKILNAQNAGAIAVVMVNNIAGPPIVMGGSSAGITIPGLMISQSDGDLIKTHLVEGVTVKISAAAIVHTELTDQISDFSSRGPAAPNSVLKPEIAAPGYSITSVKVGGGTAPTDMSGTSMASPHVAGAAGLMRQLHPDWSTEEIKAALMNTARQTHNAAQNAYPESRTGAGRIQMDDAARVVVTAKAENSGGLVSLSLGALVLTNTYATVRNIVLTNHGAAAVSYSVAISNTVSENGVTVTSLTNSVTVPGHASALVPIQYTANPSLFDRTPDLTTSNLISGSPRQFLYETSGEVWFLNTNLSIHVPYYANVRSGSAFQAGVTNLTLTIGSNALTASISIGGFSTHPQPLVSAFNLGLVSTNQMLPAPDNSTDLLAIGAASDAPQQSQFSNATLYFALATAGDWASPTRTLAEFDFQIDTNADGVADVVVFNNSLGNTGGEYSDVFESQVGGFVYRFVNCFSAAERDTAPFNNSVLVLPIPVTVLGLGVGHSQFRYRVITGDYFGLGETTPWVTFDAARPVLDTTGFGISGRPFFADGGAVSFKADPNAVAANGTNSPSHAGLMLLHHFNTAGNRLEIVDIRLVPWLYPPQLQGNNLLLSWSSASNGVYSIQYATNLNQGFVFTAVSGLGATPPLNTFGVANGPGAARFYRVKQD